jgi:putative FmdB family regulatory protein
MPTYDYACVNCGHVIEVVHGVHDTGPTVCPQCGGLLRKRLTSPAIHFRGSGWAKKDARDAAETRRSSASSSKGRARGDHETGASKAPKSAGSGADTGAGGSSPPAGGE